MFHETHKKGEDPANSDISKKCDKIRDTIEKDPSLSHLQIAEKVFKSKSRDCVVGYGGGVKLKDIRGSYSSRSELEAELNTTRKENQVLANRVHIVEAENQTLTNRVHSIEAEMTMFKDVLIRQFNIPIPSSETQ